jgi:hypothetical protein
MRVGSGEIPVTLEHVIADDGFPSKHSNILNAALELGRLAERAGR